MNQFFLNEAHDISLASDGTIDRIGGTDSVAQRIKQRLLIFSGEWFLDRRAGFKYYQHVLKKGVNVGLIESLYKARILATVGVVSLREFKLDYDNANRIASVSFCAITESGIVHECLEVAND